MEPFETDGFERRVRVRGMQVPGMNSPSPADDGFFTAYSKLVWNNIRRT